MSAIWQNKAGFCTPFRAKSVQPVHQGVNSRIILRMKKTVAILAILLPLSAWAGDFVGPVQVKDGDSIFIEGRELRVFGIDVPEWSQV